MAILTIGRVGLNVVDLDHPASWKMERSFDNASIILGGYVRSTTIANAKYLRNELLNQQGSLIALTYTGDDFLDGFYILRSVRMETVINSYRIGLFPFELDLFYIGNHSSTELQSLLTVGDVQNDFSTTPFPFHAVPVGALAYNAGPTGTPTERIRETEEGNLSVFEEISATEDPSWAVSPASYYLGSSKVFTAGMLRAGLTIPANSPTDWYISNGLVEVRASVYQGSSDGDIELRFYDGSAWTQWIDFRLVYDDINIIPQWHYLTIVRNTPEAVTVRLVRDAATVPASAHRHSLDVTLRRGSHFAAFIWNYTFTHAGAVYRDTADAATRPGGASYIYDSDTIDSQKWILGSPRAFTEDTTNGGIVLDVEATAFPFWIGFLKGGSVSNDTGDGPADLAKQYTGWVSETVRAIRR